MHFVSTDKPAWDTFLQTLWHAADILRLDSSVREHFCAGRFPAQGGQSRTMERLGPCPYRFVVSCHGSRLFAGHLVATVGSARHEYRTISSRQRRDHVSVDNRTSLARRA